MLIMCNIWDFWVDEMVIDGRDGRDGRDGWDGWTSFEWESVSAEGIWIVQPYNLSYKKACFNLKF
jgi:hypothetical protein